MNQTVEKVRKIDGLRFLLAGASLVILIAGLKSAQAILVPFMFGVFLALIASGPIYWLIKRKVPSSIAIVLITTLVVFSFSVLLLFFVNSVEQFSEQLPVYRTNLNAFVAQSLARLDNIGIDTTKVSRDFQIGSYLNIFTKTLKGAVQAVSGFVLVIIMMVFMLMEAASFRKKTAVALKDNLDLDKIDGVAVDVQRYLVIKTFMSLLTGAIVGLMVWGLNIDFPVLWGVIAVILNYIPFIGSIIASVPAVALALVQYDPSVAAFLAIGYIVVNITISNFLEPIFMGRRLGLSVLVVFLSLIFWGWVWGPAGALMSVPLTMIAKIFLEHSPELSWVAVLMGSSKSER